MSIMRKHILCQSFANFRHIVLAGNTNFSTTTGNFVPKVLDSNSDDYQFLHKSEIPTYHFQKSLRRLPIPKLEESCQNFLNAVKAISSEEEFIRVQKVVNDFAVGDGRELQEELILYDKNNKHTSYISEPWFEMYLASRLPVPINYNPFMQFRSDPDEPYNDQLIRATNFAISCGRFKKALDACVLAPEVFHLNPKKSDTATFRRVCRLLPSNVSWFGAVAFKAFPLDMSQYKSLFGGNRIPMKGKDRLHLNESARHFLVARNGAFYTVELFDKNGKLHPPDFIHRCLAQILASSEKAPSPEDCVGSLTTLDRDSWASVREELLSDGRNSESIRRVDDALFLLCLDDSKSTDPSKLVESLLCGDDGRNRWFDKCFQLIVDGNGQATINFEHSWGDGVAILRLMEETLLDTINHRFVQVGQKPSGSAGEHQKLEWSLTDSIKQKVKEAQKKHLGIVKRLGFGTVEYKKLNKDSIKEHKLSPDAIMQLAIQMAFYEQYQEFVPTYESCSTAAFFKGRTECIRSATSATRETVLAMQNDPNGLHLLRQLINKCSEMHTQLVKEASMGKGFDRHLFGLKITAERLDRPLPQFFTDPIYQRMSHFVLSTSTLSTDTIVFGGFGPVVENGFGIGYNVSGHQLGAVVTSNQDQRDAKKFCEILNAKLDQIKYVLESTSSKL